MRGLPFDLHFPVGSVDVHLVHGSPRKVNEYLFEDKPARLYERLGRRREDRCSCSATPTNPGSMSTAGVLFVNCGSVGKPKDGDPRGAFAVLTPTPDGVAVTYRARRLRRRGRRCRDTPGRASRRVRRQAPDRGMTGAPPLRAACSPSCSARRSSPRSWSARASQRRSYRRNTWSRAVRERCGHGGRVVHDHPHVRPRVRRALQPGRLARGCEFWRYQVARRARLHPAQIAGCVLGAWSRTACSHWPRSASPPITAPRQPTCSPR